MAVINEKVKGAKKSKWRGEVALITCH